MASGHNKLSAAKVAKHCRAGYLIDGGGLYLQVAVKASFAFSSKSQPTVHDVSKSWCFRYRVRDTGRLCELGLGPFPDVSLEDARKKASEMRGHIRDGKDPKAEREAIREGQKALHARGITFQQAALACIASKRAGWKNAKHADQWLNTLTTYAFPVMGSLLVASIDLPMVLKVLEPIWATKNETASRVRQRIENILSWATVSGHRAGDNPARWRGNLDHLLAKPSKVQKSEHHAALPYAEIGAFLLSLRQRKGMSASALEFSILTAARTGEVIAARWEEFDLSKKLWTIPAERMKAGKEHIVPLSQRAAEIATELEKSKRGDFVFGENDQPLSNMAMHTLLRRMQRTDITVHGFRSTFRDWAGEQTNFPREVIEHALAHQLRDKAEAAYARSTMPERRRKLMDAWASYCHSSETSVRLTAAQS